MSWAGKNNAKITARFTAGGTKKSGTGYHLGLNPFIYAAIVNGAAGHSASLVSGLNWRIVYGQWYPVSRSNQIGGVGLRWGMFGPSADSLSNAQLNQQDAYIRSLRPRWGL